MSPLPPYNSKQILGINKILSNLIIFFINNNLNQHIKKNVISKRFYPVLSKSEISFTCTGSINCQFSFDKLYHKGYL